MGTRHTFHDHGIVTIKIKMVNQASKGMSIIYTSFLSRCQHWHWWQLAHPIAAAQAKSYKDWLLFPTRGFAGHEAEGILI